MIRVLSKGEMRWIYFEHMVKDFPKAELKKWEHLEAMLERGVYFAFGYFEEEEVLAYAFFLGEGDRKYVLLDYYAVTDGARGKGIGGVFLRQWKEKLRDSLVVIGEVEDPEFAKDEAEREIRERRIRFYQNNGLILTGLKIFVLGVEYNVMYLPIQGEQDDETVRNELSDLYHIMHPKNFPEDKIKI